MPWFFIEIGESPMIIKAKDSHKARLVAARQKPEMPADRRILGRPIELDPLAVREFLGTERYDACVEA